MKNEEKSVTDIAPSAGQLNIVFSVAACLIGDTNMHTIFEFGSRYGEDTVEFAKKYPAATVYSFECNPKSVALLKQKILSYPNIVFNEYAVSDSSETIKFYQIDENKTKTTWIDGNQGASSIFPSSGKYPVEEYFQNDIEVNAITLDWFLQTYTIAEIDILWMDIQGAELKALQGLKEKIKAVKIIHLEAEFIEIYKTQPLFKTIDKFLKSQHFYLLGYSSKTHYSADVIYVNKAYFANEMLVKAAAMIPVQTKNAQYYLSGIAFSIKYFGFRTIKLLKHFYDLLLNKPDSHARL